MQLLKADTLTKVVIGPVVAVGDGFTPVTTLSLSTADEAELLKHDAAAVTDISSNTFAAITSADGYYNLTITAAQLDTEGRLTVLINDDSLCLPVRHDFMVVNANVYDSLYAAATTDYLQTDSVQLLGSALATPSVAGVQEVDVTHFNGTAGTFASGRPEVNASHWAGTATTLSATTSKPEVDMYSVSDDATAANNIEATWDGTGYIDDNAPATQSQIQGLSIASAAQSVKVKSSPDGFVLTTGIETNTEDATQALDGVRHELSDTAGTLDCYYKFDIGPFGAPVSANFQSVINGGNDTFTIYANIGSSGTPNWSPRQTVTGTGSASNISVDVPLFESDVLTDIPTEVWLRVYGTGLTTSSFDTDFLSLSRSIQYQYSGYDNGAVWTDTTSGTAGTTLGYHGIASRPTLTFADALTIASNLGIHRHEFSNDSSVTLTATTSNKILSGRGWTLALGGQDITNIHVIDSKVSGVGTGSEVQFHDSRLTTVTLPDGNYNNCSVNGVFTLSSASVYHFHQSHSGATTPTFDFGAAVGATTLLMHNWKGAFFVDNFGAVGADIIHLAGDGEITLNASCVGGTINIQGNWKVTNNGSGVTINYDDNTSNIVATLADTNEMQGKLPTNNIMGSSVKTDKDDEIDAIKAKTDLLPTAAQWAYITAHAATAVPVTFTGGTTATAVLGNVDGSSASSTNDVYNGRVLIFTSGTLQYEATDITDYDGATKTATITAVTTSVTGTHTAILV